MVQIGQAGVNHHCKVRWLKRPHLLPHYCDIVNPDGSGERTRNDYTGAAEGGMTEVELSKIAEKSANPEVKRFAERMVRDHSAANAELTSIAAGLGIEMPKTLASEHQRIRHQLRSMHGKAFGQHYMRLMVDDHDNAVKLFRQEAGSAHNTELKQFAQKTLPTIEQHQKMALALSHRLSETAAK